MAKTICFAAKAPKDKHPMTNKFQRSNLQSKEKRLGHLQLKFIWNLGFVIWNFSFPLVPAMPG